MSFIIESTPGKTFKEASVGPHEAVLYAVIDLGSQPSMWMGEKTMKRKVKLSFEIDEKMDDGRPMVVSRDFNLTMNEKSTLRKFLEGWRSKAYTDAELEKFDISKLIGVPCILSLIENESNGKIYINIDNASKLMKNMVPMKPVNPTICFQLPTKTPGDTRPLVLDQAEFDKIPEWIKKKIVSSPEYSAIGNKKGDGFSDMENDYPFVDDAEEMAF